MVGRRMGERRPHNIGDKAEQAYRRSDGLEKRRKLMKALVRNVIQISRREKIYDQCCACTTSRCTNSGSLT